jgi:hypothetical protein
MIKLCSWMQVRKILHMIENTANLMLEVMAMEIYSY